MHLKHALSFITYISLFSALALLQACSGEAFRGLPRKSALIRLESDLTTLNRAETTAQMQTGSFASLEALTEIGNVRSIVDRLVVDGYAVKIAVSKNGYGILVHPIVFSDDKSAVSLFTDQTGVIRRSLGKNHLANSDSSPLLTK